MLLTLLGCVLVLVPFLPVLWAEDRTLAFVRTAAAVIALHTFLGLATQALGVFSYGVIVAAHLFVGGGVAFFFLRHPIRERRRPDWRFDWIAVVLVAVLFLHLYRVHYDYTGYIQTSKAAGYQQAENMAYPYPYYADEWDAVALIKDSIRHKSLPFRIPYMPGRPFFQNYEFVFHSFLSEIALLLRLDPLTDYTKITIVTGILICLLVYLFLAADGTAGSAAAIVALGFLYVTNGANLPGIWYLIPLMMGLICLLLSFILMVKKDYGWCLAAGFLSLLFYPPLFPFYTLALFVSLFEDKEMSFNRRARLMGVYAGIVVISAALVAAAYVFNKGFSSGIFRDILTSKLVYESFTTVLVPDFNIKYIIPPALLLLAVPGVFLPLKRRVWLKSITLMGLMYWGAYYFVTYRFIIEWQRVIVLTSILITLLAGYGLDRVFCWLDERKISRQVPLTFLLTVFVFAGFLFASENYTRRDNWKKLVLRNKKTGDVLRPAAPANRYVHPDDLRLFSSLEKEMFLSPPWKGTVIGAATSNYPASMKSGTISKDRLLYKEFVRLSCPGKGFVVRRHNLDYVYSEPFSCPGYERVGSSREGLVLYKTPLRK